MAAGFLVVGTDIVGNSLKDFRNLSNDQCCVIKNALISIHTRGYIHGDVRESNIRVEQDGDEFRAYFIDLAFPKRGNMHEPLQEQLVLSKILISL